MEIHLARLLERLVRGRVASGLYASPEEVIHEGLRLLLERDTLARLHRERLRFEAMEELELDDDGGLSFDGPAPPFGRNGRPPP